MLKAQSNDTDAELGPSSQADFKCLECDDLLSIYSDWTSSVKCSCGYTWTITIKAYGTKWIDDLAPPVEVQTS